MTRKPNFVPFLLKFHAAWCMYMQRECRVHGCGGQGCPAQPLSIIINTHLYLFLANSLGSTFSVFIFMPMLCLHVVHYLPAVPIVASRGCQIPELLCGYWDPNLLCLPEECS